MAGKWDGNYSVSVKLNGHNTGPCANANNVPLKLNLDIKDNYIVAKLMAQCSYLDGFVSGRIKNDGNLNLILRKQVPIYGQRNKAGAIGSERFFTQISGRIDGKIVINSNYNLASISRTEIRFKRKPKKTQKTSQSTSSSDPLSTAFKSLSSKTRKDIQKVLKDKGFYRSTIDGLYGKGTRKSIVDFFKDKELGDDLDKLDLRKELSIIANLNLIKEKEALKKEKEIADKKEQEQLLAEKLEKQQMEKEEKEKEQARLEKEKQEEEKRKAKEKAVAEKVNAYKDESSDLINDIKSYMVSTEDFDVLELGKLFIEVEPLIQKDWTEKTVEAYEKLKNFVFASEKFQSFYREQENNRFKKYQDQLKEIKQNLTASLTSIKKYISENLGSPNTLKAIEMAEMIKQDITSVDLSYLQQLKSITDEWLQDKTGRDIAKKTISKNEESSTDKTKNEKSRVYETGDKNVEKDTKTKAEKRNDV
ncbi:peptidoglycan-binding protein, partial [Paracoccaceae bacterium]|nr:peptidoglycan-binding protein [Paracoccaceae bacterium]